MKTALDCIPCILRQTLDAARLVSDDPAIHSNIMRDTLGMLKEIDFNQSPPAIAQIIHRSIRKQSGINDPYSQLKTKQNQLALEMIPILRDKIKASPDPLLLAARLAIAGNIIDLGVNGDLKLIDIQKAVDQALSEPFVGDAEQFRQAVNRARSILYLADNAGEIAFDSLLIEQLAAERVTLAVRGSPVINDATIEDAKEVGLDKLVKVMNNGSDAPGTILGDCDENFQQLFHQADLIIAKGQGNFETLSEEPVNIFFLFKVKCLMVASLVGQPIGTQILLHGNAGNLF
jgi:uncharacterized protein with ATP-grasp and redox domains